MASQYSSASDTRNAMEAMQGIIKLFFVYIVYKIPLGLVRVRVRVLFKNNKKFQTLKSNIYCQWYFIQCHILLKKHHYLLNKIIKLLKR